MKIFFSFIYLFVKDDAQEEFGWKLVHGDVFRPPKKGMLLSIMLGCGSQIFIMVFFTLGKLAILLWWLIWSFWLLWACSDLYEARVVGCIISLSSLSVKIITSQSLPPTPVDVPPLLWTPLPMGFLVQPFTCIKLVGILFFHSTHCSYASFLIHVY